MDKWLTKNPKSAAYMLYLSAVIIVLLIGFIYYYQKTQKHLSVLSIELIEAKKREKMKSKKKDEGPPPLGPNEDPDFIEEEDGFQILVEDDM